MPESLLSRYMDTNEASKVWGYPRNTVSRWCQQGKIPGAIQASPLLPLVHPQKRQVSQSEKWLNKVSAEKPDFPRRPCFHMNKYGQVSGGSLQIRGLSKAACLWYNGFLKCQCTERRKIYGQCL